MSGGPYVYNGKLCRDSLSTIIFQFVQLFFGPSFSILINSDFVFFHLRTVCGCPAVRSLPKGGGISSAVLLSCHGVRLSSDLRPVCLRSCALSDLRRLSAFGDLPSVVLLWPACCRAVCGPSLPAIGGRLLPLLLVLCGTVSRCAVLVLYRTISETAPIWSYMVRCRGNGAGVPLSRRPPFTRVSPYRK